MTKIEHLEEKYHIAYSALVSIVSANDFDITDYPGDWVDPVPFAEGAIDDIKNLEKHPACASRQDAMTPDEFHEKMLELETHDPEMFHIYADELIVKLLIQLGYGAGAVIFRDHEKWYS